MISTIFLDAGGVLVDETEFESMRAETIVATLAPVVTGYDLQRYWRDIANAVRDHFVQVDRFPFERNLPDDIDRADELFRGYRANYAERRPPLQLTSGILRQIVQLKQRFRIGYAGQYGYDLFQLLEERNILHEFCVARTEQELGAAKPDPEYYRRLVRAAGVSASECVMVGDRIDKDIAPAKLIGMKAVRVRAGIHRDQPVRSPGEAPDMDIEGVDRLADVMFEMADRD